jgi:hypothetical protein
MRVVIRYQVMAEVGGRVSGGHISFICTISAELILFNSSIDDLLGTGCSSLWAGPRDIMATINTYRPNQM